LKKSTQWDIIGIVALTIGLGAWISIFQGGGFFKIGNVNVWISNPFLIVFAVVFSFMCFSFGFFEGKKEEQRQFNPSKR